MGYHRAGFEVTGVDKFPMKNYPFEFIQADALDILDDLDFCRSFDLIHASPECQEYSVTNGLKKQIHGRDIEIVREKLQMTERPYVIENVPGSTLKNYVQLCGSMFGLQVRRHRLFECWPEIYFPPYVCSCLRNKNKPGGRNGKSNPVSSFANGDKTICVVGKGYVVEDGKKAMGIDWMPARTLSQAIPPAYTEWVGKQMIIHLHKIVS